MSYDLSRVTPEQFREHAPRVARLNREAHDLACRSNRHEAMRLRRLWAARHPMRNVPILRVFLARARHDEIALPSRLRRP